MISIDTNILFHAFNADSPLNGRAYDWLASQGDSERVAISEFVLAELYRLVRNPISARAEVLSPQSASNLIEAYRNHPRWMLVGFAANSRSLHDQLWKEAAKSGFAYRKLYDLRTALTLLAHGVTSFATTNAKDFEGVGFAKDWNPLDGDRRCG
jgi:predicted nucleic acid-binding protein